MAQPSPRVEVPEPQPDQLQSHSPVPGSADGFDHRISSGALSLGSRAEPERFAPSSLM